ncbi:MAG: hypothetical protein A3C47_04750 [Omnitrophica bacterium RIFCSPHIGHO2_02_FULL_51_18]|nr:MAG: hypothetical protein A3C47_04750 [Omnitrophica bacterium RIFCSPHIGHO2_02_FULL_51_18]
MGKKKMISGYYYALSVASLLLIGTINHHFQDTNLPPLNPSGRYYINILLLNLLASYFYFIKQDVRSSFSLRQWGFFLFAAALLCLMAPVFSGDLFEYIFRGRILAVYHANPYLAVPNDFSYDPFYAFSIWRANPETYGPLFVAIECLPAFLFRNSMVGAVAFQKLIFLGFMGLAGLYLWKIAVRIFPGEAHKPWLVFSFNPLLIVTTLIDGHNDIVMLALTLVSIHFFLRNQYTRSFIFWTLAFLTKYTVVILLPLLVVMAVRHEWKKEAHFPAGFILRQTVLNFSLMGLIYFLLWGGDKTFAVLQGFAGSFYSNTIPYLLHRSLQAVGLTLPEQWFRTAAAVFFIGVNAVILWRAGSDKDGDLKVFFRRISLIYMAFYASLTSPFLAHYLIWVLPWVILSGWPKADLLIMLVSFAGLFAYFKRINYLIVLAVFVYGLLLVLSRKKTERA